MIWPFKKSKLDNNNFEYRANNYRVTMADGYLWINGVEFSKEKNDALYALAICLNACVKQLGQR